MKFPKHMMPTTERRKCTSKCPCRAVTVLKRIYRTKRLFILGVIAFVIFVTAFKLPVLPERPVLQEENIVVKRTVKNLDYYLGHNYEVLKKELQEDVARDEGMGCKMPKVNPFSGDALRFVKQAPAVVCEGNDWVECFLNECYVVKKILENFKNVTCEFQDIYFVTHQRYKLGPIKKASEGQKYSLTNTDHVKVRCTGASSYNNTETWVGYKTGFRRLPPLPPPCCGAHLNILMLCLNSASRSSFVRRMPKSYATLMDMDAVFLNGYNVVDSETALLPILTGKSEYEFPELRKGLTDDFLNESQFIFSPVSQAGYRTAYFEDVPFQGAFQKRFNGFETPPTDHYMRPKLRDAYLNNIGNRCLGDQALHAVVLNMTFQFFLMEGYRFAISLIGGRNPDGLNTLYSMDEDLAYFLHRFQQGGRLTKTMLFVMGDHGERFGIMRETPQGGLEERLPLMAIVSPRELQINRPEADDALRANADVLVTPYDIHSTLMDLLAMGELRNRLQITMTSLPRAMTLLQPIPDTRSCGEAGVPAHWCACAPWLPVSPEEPIYKKVAEVTADYIRNLTVKYRYLCEDRKLISIVSVFRHSPKTRACNPDCGRYRTTIIMNPSRSVFEATLKYVAMPEEDYFEISQMDISRINGNPHASSCLFPDLQHLVEFCSCKK